METVAIDSAIVLHVNYVVFDNYVSYNREIRRYYYVMYNISNILSNTLEKYIMKILEYTYV